MKAQLAAPANESTKGGATLRHLALVASIVVSMLAASSAPTPLYPTYAIQWDLSPIATTLVFAVYAIAVLAALLVLGRLSDHIGRRPVLLATLAMQTLALGVLVTAGGEASLLIGRVLQGLATGAAIGALGATMMDIDRVRGAIANSAAPGMGSGVGVLFAGLVAQYLPAPTRLIYLILGGVFVLQALGVLLMPETVSRRAGVLASLRPVLAVPHRLRRPLLAAAPILFSTWALTGLFGSLGPALAHEVTGSTSMVVGALALFLVASIASMTTVALDRMAPRRVMLLGIAFMLVGTVATLVSVSLSSPVAYFASTAVSGIGFGAGFQGGIRTVVPLAEPHERAGVLSVLFIVCYLGLGIPAVAAGFEVVHGGGLARTARDYGLFLIVLCLAALSALLLTGRAKVSTCEAGNSCPS